MSLLLLLKYHWWGQEHDGSIVWKDAPKKRKKPKRLVVLKPKATLSPPTPFIPKIEREDFSAVSRIISEVKRELETLAAYVPPPPVPEPVKIENLDAEYMAAAMAFLDDLDISSLPEETLSAIADLATQ